MMRLFGGFDRRVLRAYDDEFPLGDGWEGRVPLHQLAPLTVHAIKFGGGYVSATDRALTPCSPPESRSDRRRMNTGRLDDSYSVTGTSTTPTTGPEMISRRALGDTTPSYVHSRSRQSWSSSRLPLHVVWWYTVPGVVGERP